MICIVSVIIATGGRNLIFITYSFFLLNLLLKQNVPHWFDNYAFCPFKLIFVHVIVERN